ncbi:hypothetical protein TNCV_4581111 [Trichonephila clavipes]|nr:hypothetical protein TNCV_4581111 [Trichonephila clavipes]
MYLPGKIDNFFNHITNFTIPLNKTNRGEQHNTKSPPLEGRVYTSGALKAPAQEDVSTTAALKAPAQEDVSTTAALKAPAQEDVSTTAALKAPAQEDVYTRPRH